MTLVVALRQTGVTLLTAGREPPSRLVAAGGLQATGVFLPAPLAAVHEIRAMMEVTFVPVTVSISRSVPVPMPVVVSRCYGHQQEEDYCFYIHLEKNS